jgi:hypothetical protein
MFLCTHAAKPRQPRGTSGSIQKILGNDQSESSETGSGIAAIASLNWNPPENHNETAIDFYELTLIGAPNNNTFFYRATTQQTFSSKYVLSEGNYTAVRVTAVDLCEQRSDPSQIMLSNINNSVSIGTVATTPESITNQQSEIDELNDTIKKQKGTIDTLAIILGSISAIIIAIVIIIIAALIIVFKCGSGGSADL